MRTSARRKSYSMDGLPPLEHVDKLEHAFCVRALRRPGGIGEERRGRPVGPDGGAQRDLREMESRVLDVAEDSLAGVREVPHRADGDRAEDLRRPREQAVGVYHLIVARGEADMAARLQECRHRSSAPRRIAAALLLP